MKAVHLEKKITTEEGHTTVFESEEPKMKEQQNVCDICSYFTTKKFNFLKHLKTHDLSDHPTKCDKCEYTSSHRATLARHIANTKHDKGNSRSTQYRRMRNMNVPKSNYKSFKNTNIEPEIRVLGEEDVIKLVEDMNCLLRDLMKAIKWVRHCLGSKHVVKGIKELIEKHLRRMEDDHEVEPVVFKDKDGKDKLSSLAKVKDLPSFLNTVSKLRGIEKPKLTLGIDGNTNQLVISGIVSDENESENEDKSKFNNFGPGRVLLLAKADGVAETYHNVKIFLDSLDLPSLAEYFQIVCDLKIIKILLGIQSCSEGRVEDS